MVVAAAGGAPKALGAGRRIRRHAGGSTRAISSSSARRPISSGGRRRWWTSTAASRRSLHEDVEDKFWSMTGDAGGNAQPSPDGKWIAFLSDRDGWDHLYVMPAAGGDAVQITKGQFEVVARRTWSPDSTRIAFDANEPDHYGDRHLYVATIGSDPAHATIAALTSGRGTDIAPQWSPDGTRLVYQHTDPHNSADLWVIDAKPNAKPARLSRLDAGGDRQVGARRAGDASATPDPTARQVPAWLFVPKNLDRIEEASGDRVDSRRRREPELRRLARAAQLRGLLQLPPVPAAAGLRRHRARLSRQHRLRRDVARGRLHGRRRQGREGRVDGGELSEDAAVRRHAIASACGA